MLTQENRLFDESFLMANSGLENQQPRAKLALSVHSNFHTDEVFWTIFWQIKGQRPVIFVKNRLITSDFPTASTWSYYVQLQIVAQSFRTLHPDQNGLLQLRAEAHCQPVCPRARPVIGWPGVRDEGSSSPEDVSCPSCKTKQTINKNHKKRMFSCSITVLSVNFLAICLSFPPSHWS